MSGMRMRLFVLSPAIVICLTVSAAFLRIDAAQADVKLPILALKDTRLANGLRVVLAPDHSPPYTRST